MDNQNGVTDEIEATAQDVEEAGTEPDKPDAPTIDEDSTVGIGSAMAIGCSLIVLLILLGGICLFMYRQVS